MIELQIPIAADGWRTFRKEEIVNKVNDVYFCKYLILLTLKLTDDIISVLSKFEWYINIYLYLQV